MTSPLLDLGSTCSTVQQAHSQSHLVDLKQQIEIGKTTMCQDCWLASTLLHQVSQDVVLVKIAVGLKFEFLTFKLDHNKMSFTTELYDNYIQTVE